MRHNLDLILAIAAMALLIAVLALVRTNPTLSWLRAGTRTEQGFFVTSTGKTMCSSATSAHVWLARSDGWCYAEDEPK